MCFYTVCDWYPEVAEDAIIPGTKASFCYECHMPLPVGEPRRHVYYQEHEECPQCKRVLECANGCAGPGIGKTFEADLCLRCCSLLNAILAVEIEAGCRPDESQPAFGELGQALRDDMEYEWGSDATYGQYGKRALEMYPQIGDHLKRLAK